jgi:hypothetical protein
VLLATVFADGVFGTEGDEGAEGGLKKAEEGACGRE